MKLGLFYLLLSLVALGCSRNTTDVGGTQSQNQNAHPTTGLPFTVTVVETPETKEINDLSNQVVTLLTARKYDDLDALAKHLRDSRETHADGVWKLFFIYGGLDLPDEASDGEWTGRLAELRDWIKSKPESITARVAMANELVSFAWKARSGDYADKVPEASWKLFFQRLNEAVDTLDSARNFKEKCPVWWSVLLKAELGLQVQRAQYDATFNTATKAWPDYTPCYFRRAIYLLPRWYGAAGEWEKDLAMSADKIGGEDGDMLYARVVWDVHQNIYSTNIFQEYQLSWSRVNSGFGAIERHFPNSLAVKNEGARLAVLARDEQAAKKYFDQTAGKVDMDCWDSKDDYVRFADLVYGCAQ